MAFKIIFSTLIWGTWTCTSTCGSKCSSHWVGVFKESAHVEIFLVNVALSVISRLFLTWKVESDLVKMGGERAQKIASETNIKKDKNGFYLRAQLTYKRKLHLRLCLVSCSCFQFSGGLGSCATVNKFVDLISTHVAVEYMNNWKGCTWWKYELVAATLRFFFTKLK